jgi:hypothetical protein
VSTRVKRHRVPKPSTYPKKQHGDRQASTCPPEGLLDQLPRNTEIPQKVCYTHDVTFSVTSEFYRGRSMTFGPLEKIQRLLVRTSNTTKVRKYQADRSRVRLQDCKLHAGPAHHSSDETYSENGEDDGTHVV